MGVFDSGEGAASEVLQAAAIAAADALGVGAQLAAGPRTLEALARALGLPAAARLRPLLDVLVALGGVTRAGAHYAAGAPLVATAPFGALREGWGELADVIRADRPLALPAGTQRAYHAHLVRAGAAAAREVAPWLVPVPATPALVDVGGGAGGYTTAFLDAHPGARATLVDAADVIALAAEALAPHGARVTLIAGDGRDAEVPAPGGAALLANVLHGNGPAACAALCAAAARAVVPGGVMMIVELRVDDGRRGPLAGLLFAINMALYTAAGDVYETRQLRAWLAAAGLVGIEERRLASAPEMVVVLGYRPRGAGAALAAAAGHAEAAAALAAELAGRLAAVAEAESVSALALPAPLARVLPLVIAAERADGRTAAADDLITHYLDRMPRARCAQLASRAGPAAALLHTELDWARLPRLAGAVGRLFGELAAAGVEATPALGAPDLARYCARTPTVAALYARTHYGRVMPLLYGNLPDLAYFSSRGLDAHAAIDRYLTTPLVHELCHLGPDRDALQPLHLDECVAGWLGVDVHPEFAYPAPGEDDGIFAAPWLSQVGQAVVRAFGRTAVVRAHAGAVPWDAAVPKAFVDAAARLGWADWRARRTLHLLSDTLAPAPWVALALAAGAGRPLAGETLASLAALPLAQLADALPAEPALDRAIVEDALRAMCLDNLRIEGSFRARTGLPADDIVIEAAAARVWRPRRGDVDAVDPSYWLPPAVAAAIAARGLAGYTLRLRSLAALPVAAAAIAAARPGSPVVPLDLTDGTELRAVPA